MAITRRGALVGLASISALGVLAIIFEERINDSSIKRWLYASRCNLTGTGCSLDIPVLVRWRSFPAISDPVSLRGAKLWIALAASIDAEHEADYRAKVAAAATASGAAVSLSKRDADMQAMLSAEGRAASMPYLPGWGRATRLVALDISAISPRGTDFAYSERRQVHYFYFGDAITEREAVAHACETFFGELAARPAFGIEQRTVSVDLRS